MESGGAARKANASKYLGDYSLGNSVLCIHFMVIAAKGMQPVIPLFMPYTVHTFHIYDFR